MRNKEDKPFRTETFWVEWDKPGSNDDTLKYMEKLKDIGSKFLDSLCDTTKQDVEADWTTTIFDELLNVYRLELKGEFFFALPEPDPVTLVGGRVIEKGTVTGLYHAPAS